MSHSIDTNTSRALIIGASEFPKDSNLNSSESVLTNIKAFAEILSNDKIIGLSSEQVNILENNQDNTSIKEQLALTAEQSGSTLIVYYTGHIVIRKGQLYLSTYNSTIKQVHVNGISLAEVMAILDESETSQKILIFDAVYTHTVEGASDDIEKLVKGTFNTLEEEYSDTFLISSPSNNYSSDDTPNFTTKLVDVLLHGIPEEKGTLSLQDIYDALSTLSEQENKQGFPIFGKKGRKSTITFAYNHQFIRFRDLRKQAEKLFDEGNYQEVLPLYREASKLFPENEYINKKLQFTSHFILANELFGQKEFLEAKKNFEEAHNFFDLPIISAKINECIEKLASELYDQSDYVQALPYYEYLVKNSESNIFYNRRLKVCQDEIRFTELIDKADRAYFEDNYTKALQFYNAALEINLDNLVVRRKEDCERFIEKEQNLREKLKREIADEMLQKQHAVIQEKIEEEKIRLKKEFKTHETDFLAKAREEASEAFEGKVGSKLDEMEGSFWKRLSVWNDIEGYKFYLDFFPEGKYAKKAKKRIQQLEDKHTTQSTIPVDEAVNGVEITKPEVNLNGIHKESVDESPNVENFEDSSQVERISLADLIKPTSEEEQETQDVTAEPEQAEVVHEVTQEEAVAVDENITESHIEEVIDNNTLDEEIESNSSSNTEEVTHEVDTIPQDATEDELWDYACNANTVASYMNYINNTKESRYIAEAYNNVGELSRLEAEEETEEATPELEDSSTLEAKSESNEVVESPQDEIEPVNSTVEQPTPTSSSFEGSSEEQLWQNAVSVNTVASYMEYIESTKDGEHIADAYFRINQINSGSTTTEPESTQVAPEVEDTNPSPSQVLEDNTTEENVTNEIVEPEVAPSQNGVQTESSMVATVAKSDSTDIEEETLWQRAKAEDTVSAYFNYMNKTTEKRYWDLAKTRIGELKNNSQSQELQDWTQAQEEDTVDSYKKYIRKYPLGNYYAKAMFRLNRLES